MKTALSVSSLKKSYNGFEAVKDISFELRPGEILGLIGPNGAGKSTTIKMILDFMKPDIGEIEILGGGMDEALKNDIGYLPEAKGLYQGLSVIDCILYLSSLKGMKRTEARARAEVLLERAGLFESRKKKIKNISKGMGQMVQFIITIIHDPDLLIMDEPFSGLDPVNTELMKNIISELRDEEKAIILSTHQMNQVEELCDRILMISRGEEVLYGYLKDIQAGYRANSVQVEVDGEFGSIDGVVRREDSREGVELFLAEGVSPSDVLDSLRGQDIVIKRFEISTPSLHEIFIDVVGETHE